jgi:hypothetical protein
MIRYSSTDINIFTEHCPKALDFVKQGYSTATDNKEFGVAAHAVLQECGEKNASGKMDKIAAIADSVAERLITNGRFYYSQLMPPMKPEVAFGGRDLAVQFLQSHSIPWPAKFEIVLSMDSKGNACHNDKARWGAIIDVVYEEKHEDEEYAEDLICIDDYKSSWQADEDELMTLQRKGHAVLGWLHYPHKQGVRVRVINIRTGKIFDRFPDGRPSTIYFDDEGIQTLKQWRNDILATCRGWMGGMQGKGRCIDARFRFHARSDKTEQKQTPGLDEAKESLPSNSR